MNDYKPHPLRRLREDYYKKLPKGAVLVARPTRWGNPFTIDPGMQPGVIADGLTVEEAVARAVAEYRAWLRCAPRGIEVAAAARRELGGRELYCYCRLYRPCHADVLAEVANG